MVADSGSEIDGNKQKIVKLKSPKKEANFPEPDQKKQKLQNEIKTEAMEPEVLKNDSKSSENNGLSFKTETKHASLEKQMNITFGKYHLVLYYYFYLIYTYIV